MSVVRKSCRRLYNYFKTVASGMSFIKPLYMGALYVLQTWMVLLSQWISSPQWSSSPGAVFTKILILRIFLRIVGFLRKILRIRIFLFTKILILRITLILRIFLRMAFILRIFLNCYMHKTFILDTKRASKYRKSLMGLYSQWFLEIFLELHLV